jgi:hypothetical protein
MSRITKLFVIRYVVRFLKRFLDMSDHGDVFKPVIPWQCLADSLAIVRTKDYSKENTGKLMQHVAYFIGCTGKMISGEPKPGPDPDSSDDWLFQTAMPAGLLTEESLEERLDECYHRASAGMAAGPSEAIPWQAIWQIAGPIMLELLKRWLEKATAK